MKRDISITMDASQTQRAGIAYTLGCNTCPIQCRITFQSPRPLLLASAGRYVGLFSSLCRALDKGYIAQCFATDGLPTAMSSAQKVDPVVEAGDS